MASGAAASRDRSSRSRAIAAELFHRRAGFERRSIFGFQPLHHPGGDRKRNLVIPFGIRPSNILIDDHNEMVEASVLVAVALEDGDLLILGAIAEQVVLLNRLATPFLAFAV